MLNYNTLLSNYDDKLTLLQFLKKVEAALADASLESVEVSQPTETQAVLTFKFADGSELAAPAIELPRGASVVNATLDASNNLILVLDDGRNINVGNIMPQNINAQSGTFSVSLASPSVTAGSLSVSGDATISGNATIGGDASVTGELYADRVRTDGIESYGNVEGAGLNISGNGSVGGDLAVTGDVSAAEFNGENARPIYWHTIKFQRGGTSETSGASRIQGYVIVLNNSPELLTLAEFIQLLQQPNFCAVVINGIFNATPAGDMLGAFVDVLTIKYNGISTFNIDFRDPSTNNILTTSLSLNTEYFAIYQDLGANKLNA